MAQKMKSTTTREPVTRAVVKSSSDDEKEDEDHQRYHRRTYVVFFDNRIQVCRAHAELDGRSRYAEWMASMFSHLEISERHQWAKLTQQLWASQAETLGKDHFLGEKDQVVRGVKDLLAKRQPAWMYLADADSQELIQFMFRAFQHIHLIDLVEWFNIHGHEWIPAHTRQSLRPWDRYMELIPKFAYHTKVGMFCDTLRFEIHGTEGRGDFTHTQWMCPTEPLEAQPTSLSLSPSTTLPRKPHGPVLMIEPWFIKSVSLVFIPCATVVNSLLPQYVPKDDTVIQAKLRAAVRSNYLEQLAKAKKLCDEIKIATEEEAEDDSSDKESDDKLHCDLSACKHCHHSTTVFNKV